MAGLMRPPADRFDVRDVLGRGGFGTVFAAFDRVRGLDVAVKVLHTLAPDAVLRLKTEFRSVQSLSHPNLVRYYDLACTDDGVWYTTMDLIHGSPLLGELPDMDSTFVMSGSTQDPQALTMPNVAPQEPLPPARVRALFKQLSEGLAFLHDTGLVHRDLKPANVLEADGRVVVVDFGLVHETAQGADRAGTPAWMAPEQADGVVGPAADWYAMGLMLFVALTGERPAGMGSLAHRRATDGVDPRDIATELPEDLSELCFCLLRADPALRPDADAILQVFGGKRGVRTPTAFVGRIAELDRLRTTWRSRPGAVLVEGVSGIGKSALVAHFAEALRAEGALVLTGKCHEHEQVPYKAMDGVIDDLTRTLARRSEAEVAPLLPPDIAEATRLFPVLRRVRAIAALPELEPLADPAEGRLRAANALRGLLYRLAAERPMAVVIDDVQWGDADSARLLPTLRRNVPLLLLATARPQQQDGPFVAALRPLVGDPLTLDGLDDEASLVLARQLCGDGADATALAKDAGGHPLLLRGLARSGGGQSVADTIRSHVGELSDEVREVLEVLAVAGRPVDKDVARAAVGGGERYSPALSVLAAEGLAHSDDSGVGIAHDRISETVREGLDADRLRHCHLALAEALTEAQGDPEDALPHWVGAGERTRGAALAEEAGRRAVRTLAFDHAAKLFAQALALGADDLSLRTLRAEALAGANRSREAAEAWLYVADRVGDPAKALPLRALAAGRYLSVGHSEEGLRVVRQVLAACGLALFASPARALLYIVWSRLKLKLRGMAFQEQAEADVPADLLLRLDSCWAVATGLATQDTVHANAFQARHLLLALEAGEPARIAQAMVVESAFLMTAGEGAAERAEALLAKARDLVERTGSAEGRAGLELSWGLRFHLAGRMAEAVPWFEAAEATMHRAGRSEFWQLDNARLFRVDALRVTGAWRELADHVHDYQSIARNTDNLSLQVFLAMIGGNTLGPASDTPDDARATIEAVMERWTGSGFQLPDWYRLYGLGELDLYQGRAADAVERIEAAWPALKRSRLLSVELIRVWALQHRTRARVAAARAGLRSARVEAWRARWEARRMDRLASPVAKLFAEQFRGAAAALLGHTDAQLAALGRARQLAKAGEMEVWAAAFQHARGTLEGGDQGAADVQAAGEVLRGQGVVDPHRLTHMLLPSCPDP